MVLAMGWGEDQAALRLEESCWWTDRLLGTRGPLPLLHDDVRRIAPERRHLGLGKLAKHHLEARWPGWTSIIRLLMLAISLKPGNPVSGGCVARTQTAIH